MKVLEWILNLIFSITSLWDKSFDELLNEHRAYERRILIYTVIALILMLTAILITPSIELQPSDGINYITYKLYKYIGIGALLGGTYSALVSLSNMVRLIYFRYKHGITN